MADLRWDVSRLIRLAYMLADGFTRDVIGVNAFLDALPGPASEIKLHVIWGWKLTFDEGVE